MKTARYFILFGVTVGLCGPLLSTRLTADTGWPRVVKKEGKQLTIYPPQVDDWEGHTNLHFRCAIAVKGVLKEERFGVLEADAYTRIDYTDRSVVFLPLIRDLRFANATAEEQAKLCEAVDRLEPPGQLTRYSLDRVIAYLDPAKPMQRKVRVSLHPPKIFSSTSPAILVMFMGKPNFKPVETNRTDLFFALNTNWDVLYDTASRQYFLLNDEGWLTTTDVLKGPWKPAATLPRSLYSLPSTDNWAEARAHFPGKPPKTAPAIFVSTEPAEMIVTDGAPKYVPVRGTRLLRVSNTESVLFLHTGDGKLYYLAAGRWFRAGNLNGPWSAASKDLPPDFAEIPGNDPAAFVKASVPGTREAQDAVLFASVPSTTTVGRTNVDVTVIYSGEPRFVVISGTTVKYAVNTPCQVFLVDGRYYWCMEGSGFTQRGPTDPGWSAAACRPRFMPSPLRIRPTTSPM